MWREGVFTCPLPQPPGEQSSAEKPISACLRSLSAWASIFLHSPSHAVIKGSPAANTSAATPAASPSKDSDSARYAMALAATSRDGQSRRHAHAAPTALCH
eukprot:CAMPEP_0195122506 /NCGR_PEP_ID=MMETSP0448-20130528/126556_1 /TAXON_ID=66468 /ORGANISM="Heterocapsa triquestra, Strain CCMP 448" /LENGTH=100 /DNA_ID=CAMNT_0040159999 /DNA_START=238 /DNA_END=541 /DNA_ORIENTATION=+